MRLQNLDVTPWGYYQILLNPSVSALWIIGTIQYPSIHLDRRTPPMEVRAHQQSGGTTSDPVHAQRNVPPVVLRTAAAAGVGCVVGRTHAGTEGGKGISVIRRKARGQAPSPIPPTARQSSDGETASLATARFNGRGPLRRRALLLGLRSMRPPPPAARGLIGGAGESKGQWNAFAGIVIRILGFVVRFRQARREAILTALGAQLAAKGEAATSTFRQGR
mmetsp:Transcript_30544/g.63907  ORF Transcript_30544/g.63907 Transcript_30544/m.63907 type:complete len:220 (+) Transcript_30544:2161-2820(+)